jgi:hypothetical protein
MERGYRVLINKGLFIENHKKYCKKIMELKKIEDELEE